MARTPWPCADRQCHDQQHHAPREGLGRKVITHFFGRNKRETKRIPEEVWHWACRKLYQRGGYNAKKVGGSRRLCHHFLGLLREQVVRIKIWRPQATFKVQLQGPAKGRLQQYHSILSRNGGDVDGAKRQMTVTPKIASNGKSVELTDVEAVEMSHAEHIDTQLTGSAKSIAYLLDTVLAWIEDEVEAGRMIRMPPIEFLIDEAQPGDIITDPLTNYDRWTAQQDGLEYKRSPSDDLPLYVPPVPITTNKRKRSPFDDLPLYVPPAPITTNKRKRSPFDDLPLYVPPAPLAKKPRTTTTSPPTLKKQRPSPINTALANAQPSKPTHHAPSSDSSLTSFEGEPEHPESAYTEIEASPIRARGMVFAGGKRKRVLREAEQTSNTSIDPNMSTLEREQPHSAYTEIEVSPLRVRGMVFAGGKRRWVLREEV